MTVDVVAMRIYIVMNATVNVDQHVVSVIYVLYQMILHVLKMMNVVVDIVVEFAWMAVHVDVTKIYIVANATVNVDQHVAFVTHAYQTTLHALKTLNVVVNIVAEFVSMDVHVDVMRIYIVANVIVHVAQHAAFVIYVM